MGALALWGEFYTARYHIEEALKTADDNGKTNLKEALERLSVFERYSIK